jgi:hypothetical protein
MGAVWNWLTIVLMTGLVFSGVEPSVLCPESNNGKVKVAPVLN